MSGSAMAAVNVVPRVRELLHRPELASSVTRVGEVLRTIEDTANRCGVCPPPRLVAVTKTHTVEKVKWGYRQGLRHFGENYVQELHAKSHQLKSSSDEYGDIKWHYIGNIQRNKLKKLIDVPGLWMVETISKQSSAKALNICWGHTSCPSPLKVMVQVNTSGKETKLGCSLDEMKDLVQYVLEECPNLELTGLMTVGRLDHFPQQGQNPDFATLVQCREDATSSLKLTTPLELSMGMSADFEHAIEIGSTSVRVGTALFGPRDK